MSAHAPREMPERLRDAYTLNGRVAVEDRYIDEAADDGAGYVWTADRLARTLKMAGNRENMGYKRTTPLLYKALDEHPVDGHRVLVVGSKAPTYECILHEYGAQPVTIDYKRIKTPMFETHTGWTALRNIQAALSVSSIEHSGLGRYGDALDPDGDLKAMQDIRKHLPGGALFFLSVPVGADTIVWNAHRIYGPLRLNMLLEGWERVDDYGLERLADGDYRPAQPVIVLRRPL